MEQSLVIVLAEQSLAIVLAGVTAEERSKSFCVFSTTDALSMFIGLIDIFP